MIISNKVFFCKNVVLNNGYKDDEKLMPLWKMSLKLSAYTKVLMKLNISFLIKCDELVKRYINIWKKVSNTIKKGIWF